MRTINDVEMEEVTGGFLGLATVASLFSACWDCCNGHWDCLFLRRPLYIVQLVICITFLEVLYVGLNRLTIKILSVFIDFLELSFFINYLN